MALAGIRCYDNSSSRFLGGFEGGCVALFVDGTLVTRVEPLIPSDVRPITCLAVANTQKEEQVGGILVAVGKSAMAREETGNKKVPRDFEMLRITSEGEAELHGTLGS